MTCGIGALLWAIKNPAYGRVLLVDMCGVRVKSPDVQKIEKPDRYQAL
jgi:hypothetical protein